MGISYPVIEALNAANLLEKEGISAEVIDPRTLAPLDLATILEFGLKDSQVAGRR